jgi:hypothetical protein
MRTTFGLAALAISVLVLCPQQGAAQSQILLGAGATVPVGASADLHRTGIHYEVLGDVAVLPWLSLGGRFGYHETWVDRDAILERVGLADSTRRIVIQGGQHSILYGMGTARAHGFVGPLQLYALAGLGVSRVAESPMGLAGGGVTVAVDGWEDTPPLVQAGAGVIAPLFGIAVFAELGYIRAFVDEEHGDMTVVPLRLGLGITPSGWPFTGWGGQGR